MNDKQLHAWLRLIRVPKISLPTKLALLRRCPDPANLFELSNRALRELAGARRVALRRPVDVKPDLRWLEAEDHHLVVYGERAYPRRLRQIAAPPLALFVAGEVKSLANPALAIVGSRRPTPGGRTVAARFVEQSYGSGLAIVSGLALGIDGEAHQAAVRAHIPTVAVMGAGLDEVYPSRHRRLAANIVAAGGALVSEFPTGAPPLREHFPRRNRVISGLSLAVLVVEAAQRSGSLITARHALEQNREVFAVPGSPLSPMSAGCNDLIHAGASVARSIVDVIRVLEPIAGMPLRCQDTQPAEPNTGESKSRSALDEFIGFEPVSVDQLIRTSGLTAAKVSSMLLRMEVAGLLTRCSDGSFVRCK